ncbi:MAG TPA: type II toxin-antitoxin system HicA family toxin [Candidatus Angelobacter sp.]|nr:type II toxin-antitoxin system HicA family toxin [Candidatus Angelobacter sp.]
MKLRLVVEHDPETNRWSAVSLNCLAARQPVIRRRKQSRTRRKRCGCGLSLLRSKLKKVRKWSNSPCRESAIPIRNAKEVVKILRRHGFQLVAQSGSHQKWRHENGRQVIVAKHGNKPIPIGTLKSIIEGSGLNMESFR